MVLREFIDSGPGWPLRLSETFRVANRDAKSATRIARSMGAQCLDAKSFLDTQHPKPKSKTVFILGSGPSVNELSERHFAEIESHWSIGVSHWLIHPFVPDAYSIEQVENDGYEHVARLISSRLRQVSFLDNPPSILYLRPKGGLQSEAEIKVPAGLLARTFIYGRHNPVTRNLNAARFDLGITFSSIGAWVLPSNVLQDSGSSVFRMLSLAIRSGAEKIVLLGVDLDSPNYFFEAPGKADDYGLPPRYNPSFSRDSRHATDFDDNRPLSFSVIIKIMRDIGRENGRWNILVGSKSSALSGFLPLYEWG